MDSREGVPGEPPGIHTPAFQLRKTGQRPSQRIKAQFQGGGLDRVLPVIPLPVGNRTSSSYGREVLLVGTNDERLLSWCGMRR
jgi:hypothetical protein